MPKITVVELDEAQRSALEQGHRHGSSHSYRRRCQMVLLKSQGRTAQQVIDVVGGCEVVVNNWVRRYQQEGLPGLKTKPGRGRKAILQEGDVEAVRASVGEHRQRLSVAKSELEVALGKSFCRKTLADFVKKTVVSINESASVPDASRSRKFTP